MNACRFGGVFALGIAIVEACGGDLPKAEAPPAATVDARPEVNPIDGEHVDVQFVRGMTKITAPPCSRLFVAAAEGKVIAAKDVLDAGDVMIVTYPDEMILDVEGLALRVILPLSCRFRDKPGPEVAFRRAGQAPELTWARGEMHAHLDVSDDISPELYLGRLSGTAPVAEHRHAHEVEILAAVEASGTFTLAGAPRRLGARQIVTVPKDTPHSWTPDPGSKLVAWQMYLPPGPERRFVALDAAEKDAGRDR